MSRPILEDVHVNERLTTAGDWLSRRAWSRAGAIAEVLAGSPLRRALSLGTRVMLFAFGAVTIASSVALMLWNQFGPGPLDVFIGAVRSRTGLPLMFAVWMTVGSLMVLAWALGRRPGLGTVAGPLVVGPVMQVVLTQLQHVAAPSHLVVKVVVHVVAIATVGVGAGALIVSGLGAGTGELLAAAASDRTGRPEPHVRLAFEATWLISGVVLGGPIGLGTVLVAVAIGPSVAHGHRMVDRAVTSSRRQISEARFALAA